MPNLGFIFYSGADTKLYDFQVRTKKKGYNVCLCNGKDLLKLLCLFPIGQLGEAAPSFSNNGGSVTVSTVVLWFCLGEK